MRQLHEHCGKEVGWVLQCSGQHSGSMLLSVSAATAAWFYPVIPHQARLVISS